MINQNCEEWDYYKFYKRLSRNTPDCVSDVESHHTSFPLASGSPAKAPIQGAPRQNPFLKEFERGFKILISKEKTQPQYGSSYEKMTSACFAGDYSAFTSLIPQEIPDNPSYTILITRCIAICAAFGHHDILGYIFARFSNSVTLCDDKGNYPMHWAQTPQTVDFLISQGASLNPPNEFNKTTPLHTLISYGNTETALHIIKTIHKNLSAEHLNAQNDDGDTPLGMACLFGCFDVVGELLNKGANFRVLNKLKLTPMHMAAIGNQQNIMRYLVGLEDIKYQITARDMHGNTPMEVCIAFNGSHHELAWSCIEMEGKLVKFSFINDMLGGDFVSTKIGSGFYGNVYRPHSDEYRMYAIKEVIMSEDDEKKYNKQRKRFITEVGLMNSFDETQRKYFPSLIWASQRDKTHFYFVTHFFGKGNLSDLIKGKTKIPDITVNYIASEIAKGMNILHSHVPHIIHRDLTTKNIMIDDNNCIKICDFGISRYMTKNNSATMTLVGKFGFIAPELYSTKCCYSLSADVFFFGHVLYEIMYGKTPFSEDVEGQNNIKKGLMPEIYDDVDECWKTLIEKCWSIEPSKRPTFTEIASLVEGFPPKQLEDCPGSKMLLQEPALKIIRYEYDD